MGGEGGTPSFEAEAPSVHIHQALSSEAILRTVMKKPRELTLFADPELDRWKQIEFYEHEAGWRNRLILGDSLIVMTSLLEKDRLGGQVQVVYVDPPYGINYNSNFQAELTKPNPDERLDGTVTREPEQVQAYRDTWSLGVHSYLTYLRDRLLVASDLLSDAGSIFVQIGSDRVHLVRLLLDEIFGPENACPMITVQKTSGARSTLLAEVSDFILWYAKDKNKMKFNQLYDLKGLNTVTDPDYKHVLLPGGSTRDLLPHERVNVKLLPEGARVYKLDNATSQGYSRTKTVELEMDDKSFHPGNNRHWLLRVEGMERLREVGRLEVSGGGLWYRRFWDDSGAADLNNIWTDTTSSFAKRKYVVQTVPKIVDERNKQTEVSPLYSR